MPRLHGKIIVLTRPRRQSEALIEELQQQGAVVLQAPLIRTEPIENPALAEAAECLGEFDWLVFTSANGVEHFMHYLEKRQIGKPDQPRVAVIGRATAAAVENYGLTVSLVPDTASSEELAAAFRQFDLSGKRIVLLVAALTRDILAPALAAMGAQVTQVAVYRTVPDTEGIKALASIPLGSEAAVVFMSGSAAEVFASQCPPEARGKVKYCAVGNVTALRMRELGLAVDATADEPSAQEIVRALESLWQTGH